MDERQRQALVDIGGEGILFDCPMKEYTTFHIGGKAEAFCRVREIGRLQGLISYLRMEKIPYMVVGKGSNLLVRDDGVRGAVITLQGSLADVRGKGPDLLVAGGGSAIGDLLAYCRREGLGGLEFLAGIPGTAGGAVFMNAGAFGHEIGEMVQEIRMINGNGAVAVKDRSGLRFAYRESSVPEGAVIFEVAFQLTRSAPGDVAEKVADYLRMRSARQPLDLPSGGSAFKNPPNHYAGRLIEKVGLKGKGIGGALISPKHANFIVNRGGASAEDVLALMDLARKRVREETGIELMPEIRVVGIKEDGQEDLT